MDNVASACHIWRSLGGNDPYASSSREAAVVVETGLSARNGNRLCGSTGRQATSGSGPSGRSQGLSGVVSQASGAPCVAGQIVGAVTPKGGEGTGRPDHVVLRGVSKSFDSDPYIIENLNLSVAKGEFVTFLGPSGSGKTTTLMMIAGFEAVTAGNIILNGREIAHVPPYRRNIGVVFQNYALFPNMTVAENVAFPMRARRRPKPQITSEVEASLRMIQMWELRDRRPSQLSGGQQQRVALARAMIFKPELILMDEPLGALDKQLRDQMQEEIRALHVATGTTIISVTHDQNEALSMSDRVAVFRAGRIEQIGSPQDLYRRPATPFVAEFVGETNWLTGAVTIGAAGERRIEIEGGAIITSAAAAQSASAERVKIAVRPESIRVGRPSIKESTAWIGTITHIVFRGATVKLRVVVAERIVLVANIPLAEFGGGQPGSPIDVWFLERDLTIFPADLDRENR
jgi:putative spermidine/putrescine transport system ATP-binding protein